ncbi:hypothetical protein DITRI_Ditri09bG0101600 [Diplodiscus trichospermus]
MARSKWSFQGRLDGYVDAPNILEGHRHSHVGFLLQIRKFIEDDNGNVVEDEATEFLQETFLPEFEFGSYQHRQSIARSLRQAGYRNDDQGRLGRMLDGFFLHAELVLQRAKENKSESETESGVERIPRFRLCVKKFVRRQDDLEARVAELSIQEAVLKTVPATKQSIQALQKVKLQGSCTDEKCMICMEQLSSGTQEVSSMPCSHLFHGDCIEEWLNRSHQCPLCRFPMPTESDHGDVATV